MRHLYVERNTTTFAQADDSRHTLSFKRNVQAKTAGQAKLQNVQSTIVDAAVISVPVPEGCDACKVTEENVSFRLVISGSMQNKEEMERRLDNFIANVNLAKKDLLAGFLPPVTQEFQDVSPKSGV